MPEQNVLTAVGEQSNRLLEQATKNYAVCSAFVAMLWMIANTASQRGARLDGIEASAVTMTERRIRAKITFHSLAMCSSKPVSVEAKNLSDHIMKENHELAVLLRSNPDLVRMLGGIVEKMDAYARFKGVQFSQLSFGDGFMDDDDNFVLEVQHG